MKRLHIAGVINIFRVSDPKEIDALNHDPVIDRQFETRTCPLNWFFLKRSLSVLSFEGRRFPTMKPQFCPARVRAQQDLWRKLSDASADIRTGPAELDPIATWIRGAGSDDGIGILTQQLLGRLFRSDFTATQESWAAARVLVAAPRSPNLIKMLWWFSSGKVHRAKRLLAERMGGDLSAVNGIGIAVHNVAKGLRRMRALYADIALRDSLSPQAAATQCLFAPVSLYRQSTQQGKLGEYPFPKHSLFVLNIGEASRQYDGRSLVFMEESWSRCPAAQWVPAMLEGVWRRTMAQDTEFEQLDAMSETSKLRDTITRTMSRLTIKKELNS
jgi:hypothetical protein